MNWNTYDWCLQLINLFSNDGQRVYEFATMGPMIIGGVIVAIIGTIYIIYMLGPHALLGMIIFVLSYPLHYAISSANGIRLVFIFILILESSPISRVNRNRDPAATNESH